MFVEVPICAVSEETDELRLLTLETPFGEGYTTPGQYLKVRVEDKEGYFALASAPSRSGRMEILVRRTPSGVAAGLWTKAAGDRVSVSAPGGKGFPFEQARGRDLILLAAGSGVGPMRAVIHAVIRRRGDFGVVTLFYGQRRHHHFAFASEYGEWEKAGVRVEKVISRDETGEKRLAGYVQHALLDLRPDVRNAVAFLAGMKEMIAPVMEGLGNLGMPRDRVFMNF